VHLDLLAAALRHRVLSGHDDDPVTGVDDLLDFEPDPVELARASQCPFRTEGMGMSRT